MQRGDRINHILCESSRILSENHYHGNKWRLSQQRKIKMARTDQMARQSGIVVHEREV